MESDHQSEKALAVVTMQQRARHVIGRLIRAGPAQAPAAPPARLWIDEFADAGVAEMDWLELRLGRPALYANVSDACLDRLRRDRPALARATIDAARRVLRHEFDLLGSGPYTPVDTDRPMDTAGYRPIDWYADPVSGERFPRGVPLAEWNLDRMRPGRADVKLPWELARCQHWPLLGQAYRLSGDAGFALEIVRELRDFMEANPIGTAVNWACTMDVGLRAVNWAIGLDLIRTCARVETAFWRDAYRALFDHGTFIERHLENTYEVTSNHFLSNVVGLFFLSAVFDDLPRGRLWDGQCRAWLAQEMATQVLPDGADFESSVPYHRLVTELFLAASRLADYTGAPLPPHMRDRLRAMIDFLSAVQRPDGLMPQVGDADDGRVHILSGFDAPRPQDGRHLFGPAGCLLGRSESIAEGGAWAPWEIAWWGFDPPDVRPTEAAFRDGCRHFPHAGLTVMRRGRDYLLVTNGIVGTAGFGNHKHNDLLGFEYHVNGAPVLVDPGSYVYTSDPDARNLFRSTAWHNTLCVDGLEQNELRAEWLFRMFEQAAPEHIEVGQDDGAYRYRGRHHGYARAADPVVHERAFTLARQSAVLEIQDVLLGQGTHRLRWHFHFAPGVDVSVGRDGIEITGAATVVMTVPDGLRPTLSAAWYSPSYGVRLPCVALDLDVDARIDGRAEYAFRLTS